MGNHLETLVNYFQNTGEVILAYLFGSWAVGAAGPDSDYDLGILVRAPSPELRYRLHRDAMRILGTERVDVVRLNQAPVELAYGVIAQGQLLYERSLADRVEYEAYVLGRYGDMLPVLRRQREEIPKGDRSACGVQRYREALGRTEQTLAEIRTAAGKRP